MDFPVYLKYANNRSYFKVLSPEEFTEIKLIGNYYDLVSIKASILPERVYIEDMLKNEGGFWSVSSKEEFESILRECESNRKRIH